MLFTPHRRLAVWYQGLAPLLEAGIPLPQALGGGSGWKRAQRTALAEALRRGEALDTALPAARSWLPALDCELLLAGAASGRLPLMCRRLAQHHELVGKMRTRGVMAAAYPIGILHFGAAAVPLGTLISAGGGTYARLVFGVLGPLWFFGALAAFILWRWPGIGRTLMSLLPGLRGFQQARDLTVLATVLEGYVAAGVSFGAAWIAAGDATGSAHLRRVGQRLAAEVAAGRPPGPQLAQERGFPSEFVELYLSGEQTGALDQHLAWLANRYTEIAEQKLKLVTVIYPALIFFCVAVWVAVQVIAGYAGYLKQITDGL